MQLNPLKTIIGILIFTFFGCTKRYWFRTKIDVPQSNKYSVKINIINESPVFLSDDFVNAMHKSSAKELKKKGYYEVPVKSPGFIYTLILSVDSFNQNTRYFDGKNIPNTTSILAGQYPYKYGLSAIMFKVKLDYNKQYGTKWEKVYDIYYFGEKRDIVRSKGVVKFLIRTAERE